MSAIERENLTPKAIVAYLDRYIVGQTKAKRSVAVALRNRMRRRLLDDDLAREVAPKNILMVGPTGVGKTEIARRLAGLVDAPFVKVEATKFTEVGYVGRDVESMIRDLVEVAVQAVKGRRIEDVQAPAAERAEERLLDALLPSPRRISQVPDFFRSFMGGRQDEPDEPTETEEEVQRRQNTRERLREMLRKGKLEDRDVEIEVTQSASAGLPMIGGAGLEEMGINLSEMLGGLMPKKAKRRRVSVAEARRLLEAEEAEKLVDMESVVREALVKAQEEGIVFIDELDKVAAGEGRGSGPDVSREGVQRDLLPIVEGSAVSTKYGTVRTDHILFIAAGAFHRVKPSDLVPELQGRFPIRVELDSLEERDLARILVEPENSLIRQYEALLETEEVRLSFRGEAIDRIASFAARINAEMENIGARRLHTLMEHLLEEVSFEAPGLAGQEIVVDEPFVQSRLEALAGDADVRRYLL
ncbi:MAG: ATP-dependent protease ATPase subunit HslU [Synergistaceae bacterium]|jgi:ATP-dependent HslUV protease ATP-binding subunit HslU|nr:ATP-dependent protease ATPase subunit HslU [Synergistaceae bacterium]